MAPTLPERAHALVGAWGSPPDAVAVAALAAAVVLLGLAAYKGTQEAWLLQARTRRYLVVTAFAAAFLSLGYVAYYLRGGPRIIDASTYYLQARALSEGHLSWSVPEPSASFRGRFLLYRDGSISGIFPPGYPLLLSLGFLIRAPMLIGPLIGAAIAVATYALAKEIASEPVARAAALFSLASAAVRYHTADTMSHGAAALWITCAVVFALRARRTSGAASFAGVGLALGMTLATRPISAIPISLVSLAILWRSRPASLAKAALGALPGVVLLLLSQRSGTGSAFSSTQLAYYATSDGPAGCFRYGFGHGIGCLLEHGDFVKARLPDGYGFVAAVGTTLRRLQLHLSDAFNAWPLALVLVALLPRTLRAVPRCRPIAALIGLQVLAYAPFYFDGNYPGGGARLLADVLPVEHVILAVALGLVVPGVSYVRRSFAWLALMLAGFALHASFDHRSLAERDGGRPMFDDGDLRNAGATRGLVFVDSDHAFGMAHDPALGGLSVARTHGDGHDRLLFELLGKPSTFLHHYENGAVTVVPFTPPEGWSFESEAEWPPLEQRGAYAVPLWASGTCASGSRALQVVPGPSGGEVVIALPVPSTGLWEIAARSFEQGTGGRGELRVEGVAIAWAEPGDGALSCTSLPKLTLPLQKGELKVVVYAEGAPIALDRIDLTLEAPSP